MQHMRSARWAWPFTALLFGPVVRPGAIIDSSNGSNSVSTCGLSDSTASALSPLHLQQQTSNALCLRSQTSGTVSLQRLSQRSSQAAVAWLRSAGGTTHSEPTLLKNASQPSAAV